MLSAYPLLSKVIFKVLNVNVHPAPPPTAHQRRAEVETMLCHDGHIGCQASSHLEDTNLGVGHRQKAITHEVLISRSRWTAHYVRFRWFVGEADCR